MENNNLKMRVKKVFNFLYNKRVSILVFLIIIFQWKFFRDIIRYNSIVLLALFIPFGLIFFNIWIKLKKESINRSTLLTSASIFLAILFFLFQGFASSVSKLHSIQAVTSYNCEVADYILALDKEPEKYSSVSFITDDYKENYSFIYDEFGTQVGLLTKNNLLRMESANSLINVTRNDVD